jgi:2'-5' RNA ligase
MRLFIGVEIDAPVRAAAGDVAERLRQKLDRAVPELRATWISTDNLHITLWFIGEVQETRASDIVGVLQASSFGQSAFDLSIAGSGAFPPSGPPRVFWIGVHRGATEMAALYTEVGRRLAPLGFLPERRDYTAHLTIARVKDAPRGAARAVRPILSALPADCGVSRVSAVTLFRSRLSPRGATYEPLLRVPLS